MGVERIELEKKQCHILDERRTLNMDDYFSRQKMGGQINSMIDNQDSLAVVFAVELMLNTNFFGFGENIRDFSLQCETDDDICFTSTEHKILIQVKSAKVTSSQFYQILDNFLTHDLHEERKSFYVLVIFEELKVCDKNIQMHLDSFQNILQDPNETKEKKERIKTELINNFRLQKYTGIIERLRIKYSPLRRDDSDVTAIFSRCIRLAYGLTSPKEAIINNIYNELLECVGKQRRNRGSISRDTIETIIGKYLVQETVFDKYEYFIGYEKTNNGYVRKPMTEEQKLLEVGRRKAIKRILKSWRKAYFPEFVISVLFGGKKCPKCGHPMIANILGLRGIACPDCGFTPYSTLFSTCDCGSFGVIKAQPELTDVSIFGYLNEYYSRNRKCPQCRKDLSDELVSLRTVLIPVPYPFEEYKKIDRIYSDKND